MTPQTHFFFNTCIIIVAIWTKIIKGDVITCNDPSGCDWVCAGNSKCNHNVYHCPSTASYCDLTCTSCDMVQIYSSSATFNLFCMDGKGCSNLQITAQTPNSNIYLHCTSLSRCTGITLHCPSESIQNCKCIDYLQNVCLNQVYIAPIVQETTKYPTPFPSTYSTVFPSQNTIESPSEYPTQAPHHLITAPVSTTDETDAVETAFILTEQYDKGNMNELIFGTAILVTLFIGVSFVYFLYKKAKQRSSKNIFGFEESELDNRSDAVVSGSSYIMTMVDRGGTNVTVSEPTTTQVSDVIMVLGNLHTAGAISVDNDGIAVMEESQSNETRDTHDAMYGPGTTGNGMETVELGNNGTAIDVIDTDSD